MFEAEHTQLSWGLNIELYDKHTGPLLKVRRQSILSLPPAHGQPPKQLFIKDFRTMGRGKC